MTISENTRLAGLPTSTDEMDGWARCLKACLGALIGSAIKFFSLLIEVEPYDTGKFGWFGIDGVDDSNTHTATASRVRDPQFDSAIVGNSTAQMLHPAKLSQTTGLRFVQLYLTSGTPRQQLIVIDAFLRHHPKPGALVIVADPLWCVNKRVEAADDYFPYWLYDNSSLTYATRLMSIPAIERALQRISIGLGWRKRNEPNGYYSYEDIWPPGVFRAVIPPWDALPGVSLGGDQGFPEITRLESVV